ncbi:MAG: hypothetical protein K8R46_07360 [Pirellulales bacterium]|nr:hypothetical protein [Pirellulales bacterium]
MLAQLDPGSESYDKTAADLLIELGSMLTPHDKLFALGGRAQQQTRRRALVFFDNLDMVRNISAREHIRNWLEIEAENYREVATFVMCMRPENKSFYVDSDMSSHIEEIIQRPDEEEPYNDYGDPNNTHGAPIFYLRFDPPYDAQVSRNFPAPDEGGDQEAGDSEVETEDTEVAADSQVARRMAFDDEIHERRVEFLARLAGANQEGGHGLKFTGVDPRDLQAIVNACGELRNVWGVHSDALAFANGNRRLVLVSFANFVEYVVYRLDMGWDTLGAGVVEKVGSLKRKERLRSLYYQWVASEPIGELSPVFDVDMFNPIHWIRDAGWRQVGKRQVGKRQVKQFQFAPDIDGQCPQDVNALRNYYVLAAIYNRTGTTLSHRSRSAILLAEIIELCRPLGLDGDTVRSAVSEMVHGRARDHGFLETSRFNLIRKGAIAVSTDRVSVTDRACRLLERTGVMFHYLAELTHRERHKGAHEEHQQMKSPDYIIDTDTVAELIHWIRRGITTECAIIYRFMTNVGREDGYQEYCRRFCIALPGHDRGLPFMSRVVNSVRQHLQTVKGHASDESFVNELDGFTAELGGISASLTPTLRQLSRGQELIPRDGEFSYDRRQ